MTLHKDDQKAVYKIWLEYKGKTLLGKGGAEILETIKKERSIIKTAQILGMSYRYVWKYLKEINKTLNEPAIRTFHGGPTGGGGTHLTEYGEKLLKEYNRMEEYVGELLVDEEYWEVVGLKISARNRLQGKVKEVEKDKVTAKVKVQIEVPVTVTALISREAVEDLEIEPGDTVKAVIKATEVMIAKE